MPVNENDSYRMKRENLIKTLSQTTKERTGRKIIVVGGNVT